MEQKTLNTVLDGIEKRKENRDKAQKLSDSDVKELETAVNKMAENKYGKYFLKLLLRQIGWGKPRESLDGRQLLIQNGQEMVYTKLIRPYLTETNRKEIE